MRSRLLFLLIAPLLCFGPCQSVAGQTEPELQCEFERGAWCLLTGPETVQISHAANEPFYIWQVFNANWPEESAFLFEPLGCRSSVADQITVVSRDTSFSWNELMWERTVVRLSQTGQCDLELVYPQLGRFEHNFARTVLFTNIAACRESSDCDAHIAENILAAYVRVEIE